MRPARSIAINGKFYAAGINGVHRVADRLIREIDRQLGTRNKLPQPDVQLLLPKRRRWEPRLDNVRLVYEPIGHTQAWEQLVLPWRARGRVLVNLCNLAPLLHRQKLLLLHDAQFLFPDSSYPARLRWGYRILTPWMARTSTRVFTVSEYSRQMLDVFGVSRRERTCVVHNGADHILETGASSSALSAAGLAAGCYAVHFASGKAYKNSRIVFEAFQDPALSDVTLALVGVKGPQQLAAYGLKPPPRVAYLGPLDDAQLRAVYENALCLLFPSRTEGFGLPPVEAMICGCPAIVSPAGAIPEVCRDAAIYADVEDPAGWAAAVAHCRDDNGWRTAKVAAGRNRAEQFLWVKAGRTVFDAIMEMAAA